MSKVVLPLLVGLAVAGLTAQSPTIFGLAVGAGFLWLFLGRPGASGNAGSTDTNRAEWNERWTAAAATLGFEARESRQKSPASMRGTVDGHRAKVVSYFGSEPEIEIRFESGFRQLDIDRRREGVVRIGNTAELPTGDARFDELYRISAGHDEGPLMAWLTPERRDILVTLAETLNVREIEEDELEVKLGSSTWEAADLVEAVRLCTLVATVLDVSHATPIVQDAVIQDTVIQDAVIQDAVLPEDPQ